MIIGVSGKINSGKDTVGSIIQYLQDHRIRTPEEMSYEKWLEQGYEQYSRWEIKKFAGKLKENVASWIGCSVEQLEDRKFKEKELGEEWSCWEVLYELEYEGIYHTHNRLFITKEEAINWTEDNRIRPIGTSKINLTPRKMLQLHGTEGMRQTIHPNGWVNALFSDYKVNGTINSIRPDEDREVPFDATNPAHRDLVKGTEKHQGRLILPRWIITDMRFPNEAQAVKDRGGILIRINRPVSAMGPNKLKHKSVSQHPSEISLDDYEDWDYVINNKGSIEDLIKKVQDICKELEI